MEPASFDYPQLVRLWMEMGSKMAAAAAAASGESTPGDAAKMMRDACLRAWGEQTEQFTRSPQFLEMMKQSTDAAVSLRLQANDMLEKAHHAAGGVARSDLDSLLMAIRRSETRVLDKLDEISQKLDALESRLGSMPSGNGKSARAAK